MGGRFVAALFVGWVALGTPSTARAATLSRSFTGTITTAPVANPLGIAVGDAIAGSFNWDSTTLTPFFGGTVAKTNPIAPNSLHVQIGALVLPAIADEAFLVQVVNNSILSGFPGTVDAVGIGRGSISFDVTHGATLIDYRCLCGH